MAEIYSIPDNSGSNGIPFSIPIGGFGNGGFGFGNGYGQTNLMDLLGFAIVASIFPNMFGGYGNGFGGGWGGGNGAAGFLSNQINNDTGRELIMQAVTNQGEASRTAIQTLSTMLGQDFNLVNSAVGNVQSALQSLALQEAVSVPQIINSIQSGNASLASQLCKCCCDNQLAMCQQTNALQTSMSNGFTGVQQSLNNGFNGVQMGINGVQQSIASKAAADQLAMCQQTYSLNDTMNRNYISLDNKLDAMESNRKDREITALTAEVASLKSQNFTTGVVQQAVSPVLGQIASLTKEVEDIKGKLPNTIAVTYPNVTAVNNTPYMGGWNGFYGNGFGGNIVF